MPYIFHNFENLLKSFSSVLCTSSPPAVLDLVRSIAYVDRFLHRLVQFSKMYLVHVTAHFDKMLAVNAAIN